MTETLVKSENESILIIVDDNFELQSMRKPFISLAAENNIRLLMLFFDTPLEECFENNNKRSA